MNENLVSDAALLLLYLPTCLQYFYGFPCLAFSQLPSCELTLVITIAYLSNFSLLHLQRASEYRTHIATHPGGARHSCWTCGAQFATLTALNEHSVLHAVPEIAGSACRLCHTEFQVQFY